MREKNMNKHIDFQLPLTSLSTKNSEIINFGDQKELRILSYMIEEYCESRSVQGLIC